MSTSQGPLPIAACLALWVAGPLNWPLWRALRALPEISAGQDLVLGLALAGMIAALTLGLLALLAWPRIFKPACAFVLLSAAVVAHFSGSYGVGIDPGMILSALGTDLRETRDLLGPGLLFSVLGLAVLPLAWVWRRPVAYGRGSARIGRNLAAAALGVLLTLALGLLSFQTLSSTMRTHKELRYLVNPLNAFYSIGRVAHAVRKASGGPLRAIGIGAVPKAALGDAGGRPPLVLLVIGETARRDHFALNGYPRATNPELSTLGVLSFRNVVSCGTHTAASLPCMLSPLGREAFEKSDKHSENLVDLLQHAGLAVLWVENQAGCKEQCKRVPHVMARDPAPGIGAPAEALCPGGECGDEALLHGLDERIAALEPARRARGMVVVLHQMGSHGPAYSRRSPAARKAFLPECTSNALQECDRSELINAYDNSIAYTDHILAQSIRWLQRQTGRYETAMLYLSDHGESLGENNLYLHGLPYSIAPKEQTQIPLIAWFGTGAAGAPHRVDAACLGSRLDEPLSHDHLFHTVVGLARVDASEYRAALDAFAPCVQPPRP